MDLENPFVLNNASFANPEMVGQVTTTPPDLEDILPYIPPLNALWSYRSRIVGGQVVLTQFIDVVLLPSPVVPYLGYSNSGGSPGPGPGPDPTPTPTDGILFPRSYC